MTALFWLVGGDQWNSSLKDVIILSEKYNRIINKIKWSIEAYQSIFV